MNYEAAAIIARYEQEAIRRRADFAAEGHQRLRRRQPIVTSGRTAPT